MRIAMNLAGACALAFSVAGGVAAAQEEQQQQPPQQPQQQQQPEAARGAPTAGMAEIVTASAKVEKVDMEKRELTLKTDEGKPFTITVPENVHRLDNVKPGDRVDVAFYESTTIALQKPGEPMPSKRTTTQERFPGQLPGGMVAERVTTTAKVTNVDPANNEVTIESKGKSHTIDVKDPQAQAALKRLKVGDRIQATYTAAVATSVTPKTKM